MAPFSPADIPASALVSTEAAAEWLADEAMRLGLDDGAFDDDVYDVAGDGSLGELNATDDEEAQEEVIGGFEHDASTINHGGFSAQFAFLLQGTRDLGGSVATIRRQIDERH